MVILVYGGIFTERSLYCVLLRRNSSISSHSSFILTFVAATTVVLVVNGAALDLLDSQRLMIYRQGVLLRYY